MRMQRGVLSVFATLVLSLPVALAAQNASAVASDKAAVLAVVTRLFDAMRAGDSAAVRAVFHPKAAMATAGPRLDIDGVDAFARAVGTPHADQWDERIYAPVIHVDGALATVWTEYSFFIGGKFSHCGTDAFQLVRLDEAWRIFALVDTRRRTGCQTDPSK